MVIEAGVDTWSPCWRVARDSALALALDEAATVPTRRGRLLPEPVGGHRVLWFDSVGLLAAEGHPGGEGTLAPPDTLPAALEALDGALSARLGEQLPGPQRFAHSEHGFAGVRRLDATANFGARSTAEGLALLAGIAATRPPGRIAPIVRRAPGGRAIETVTWASTRGIVARAYDKGIESGTAERGRLVRLEDQRRWPSGHRRDVGELTGATVCETFRRRFAPLCRASRGVTVMAITDIATRLAELVQAGEISPAQAERAAATLLFDAAGTRVGSRPTQWRRRRLLDELGLVSADGVLDEVELDLGEVLAGAMEPTVWGGK